MKEAKGQWIVKTPIGLFYGPFLSVGPAEAWAQKEMAGGNWCLMQLRPPTVSVKEKAVARVDAANCAPNGVPYPKKIGDWKIKGGRIMTNYKGVPYLHGILRDRKKEEEADNNGCIRLNKYWYKWSAKYNGYVFA